MDNVEDVHSQLHVMHLMHEFLHVVGILTNKRHQIFVGDDVLQVLGVPRVFHVDLLAQNVQSEM